jgi:transcriptional regulator with XRE-family HTH domain
MTAYISFDEEAFRVALARSGIRFVARFAREVGISESYGRQIAKGFIPSPETQRLAARVLGVRPDQLWVRR